MAIRKLITLASATLMLAALMTGSSKASGAPMYVQDTFNWCSSTIPAGVFYRISGIPTSDPHYWPTSNEYSAGTLDAWNALPSQFFITYARVMRQGIPVSSGNGGQFVVGIDRGHQGYNSSTASGSNQNGNNTRWFPLASVWNTPGEPQERTQHWNPPVLFDKTKDGLWFQMDNGISNEQVCFQIGVLYMAPVVIVNPLP